MNAKSRFTVYLLLPLLVFTGCKEGDDTIVYQPSHRWVEKKVAVVAPMSESAPMKARFERTAQWFLDNLHQAQLIDTLCISLKLEWYDEQTEDLAQLSETLANREDVMAVIGPFGNEAVAQFAPACQRTHKTLITPTATSEEVIRRFAVGTAGVSNKEPFLWALTETDITFCEVLMNMYASYVKSITHNLSSSTPAAMFSPNDVYGRTFFDWGPYQAEEMGIPFSHNEQYTDDDDLCRRMREYYDELSQLSTFGSFDIGNFCILESVRQLYDIARVRMEWWGMDPDNPFDIDDEKIGTQQMLEGWARTYFALSNLTQESLESLGPKGIDAVQFYQGFSPYADPTTGFEKSYEVRFDTKPTFAECKFYDALLLAAFAASYVEHNPTAGTASSLSDTHSQLNSAIIAITSPHPHQLGGAAWNATSMELYLNALERGNLMDFVGASGDIRFDSENYTSSVSTTYVHWQIQNGKIEHRNYLSSNGTYRISPTMAAWNWLVENAEETFARHAENKDAGIDYPSLSAQYAVLVQGSHGWNNYRHQADVLSVYQLLKKNGFDDSHIILVIDKSLASDAKNREPGVIRAEDDGADLLSGCTIDYDNAALSPTDITHILLGIESDKTPPGPAQRCTSKRASLLERSWPQPFRKWRERTGVAQLRHRQGTDCRNTTHNRQPDAAAGLLSQVAHTCGALFLRGRHHPVGRHSRCAGHVERRRLRAVVCRQLEHGTRCVALRQIQPQSSHTSHRLTHHHLPRLLPLLRSAHSGIACSHRQFSQFRKSLHHWPAGILRKEKLNAK
ncbi:MAG: peptidase C13 [Bacteroidaceae bacterium]|nr:peptidase C13 [Bacteroidaceae bacterium]